MTEPINIKRYGDIFWTAYTNDSVSCKYRNDTHVLVYICSGEFEIDEKDKITCLHKGDSAFIRKDFSVLLKKQPFNGEQFKGIFLTFSRKFIRKFYATLDKSKFPQNVERNSVSLCKLPSSRPDIASLFESMKPYFDADIQPSEEILSMKMTEGMYVLLNTDKSLYASLFDIVDPWKIDILQFMERNFMNDLTLEEIANYTGRSLSTFKRDFKKQSDLSPEKWIVQRRLTEAHDLLSKGEEQVSKVCFKVGFKNLSHFSRIYKQAYGIAPTAYHH